MPKLRVEPSKASIEMKPHETVHDALEREGLWVETPCNGNGTCGQCQVLVDDPEAQAPTPHERISRQQAARGVRLACRLIPRRDLSIRAVPGGAELGAVGHGRPSASRPAKRSSRRLSPGERASLGLAVDIGTTTLAATVVSLATGRELSARAILNPQRRWGHDVMTRIALGSRPDGRRKLTDAVRDGINELVGLACRDAGAAPERIREAVLGGNTTMLQLAAGLDPSPLGEAPFRVDLAGGTGYRAEAFGLDAAPACRVFVPPILHAFAGADVSAGILAATGSSEAGATELLIDLGTNGELALNAGDGWMTTSAAAGPAFEGMGLTCGMMARAGAVHAVDVDGRELRSRTLEGAEPAGLCGSGALDLVAALYELGALDESGKLVSRFESRGLSSTTASRLEPLDGQQTFRVAPGVHLTQNDVRQIQLAKGALRTAIDVMLEELGVDAVDRVLLAGGFGQTLRARSLELIGLLPPGLGRRVVAAGNTCLGGCVKLLGREALQRELCERMAMVQHLMLAGRSDYMDRYVENLELPPRAAVLARGAGANSRRVERDLPAASRSRRP